MFTCPGCDRGYEYPVTPGTCGTCRLNDARTAGTLADISPESVASQLISIAPRLYLESIEGEPTAHPPGSPGKIEVMRRRAAGKEPLFVRGDSREVPDEAARDVSRDRNGAARGGKFRTSKGAA